MKSPFPGMDPYLERHWLDVHTKLVAYAADELNELLPPDLVASTEERVAVGGAESETILEPDVRVFQPPAGHGSAAEPGRGGEVLAPLRLVTLIEPITERYIKIIEAGTEHLITVIEFVSPTNKRARGLRKFRTKRAELLADGVSFVEVDLVRSGDWQALLRPTRCVAAGLSPYRATIRVPHEPEAVYLHPFPLREPLPAIRIPLRHEDPRVFLELQPLIDRAYANGRYDRRLDYTKPCDPPLESDDAAWAEELLKSAGKR